MRRYLLSAVLLCLYYTAFSTEYYSQGNGSANDLSNWNSARNGSGNAPAGFGIAGDVFIIQNNHELFTSAPWTISGSGASLKIESGKLIAGHDIQVHSFEIADAGYYVHSYSGFGLFSAPVLIFAPSSTVEISQLNANSLPLTSWGNLIISLNSASSNEWLLSNSLSSVKGNLIIRSGENFIIDVSHDQPYTLTIDGNFMLESGIFKTNWNGGIHIKGNLEISPDGILELGENYGMPELKYVVEGNVENNGLVKSAGINSLLNLTGSDVTLKGNFEIGIRILPGAKINLTGDIEIPTGFIMVVAGELNCGNNNMFLNDSYLVISGGKLNSSGYILSGNTAVCTGNGELAPMSTFGYCSSTGSIGEMNLSEAVLQINTGGNRLFIGESQSSGKLFLTNFSLIEAVGLDMPWVAIEVNNGSYLEFDAQSIISGNANFTSNDAYIVIGSMEGIRNTVLGGNVQVLGSRNFSNSPGSTYEYRSNEMQVTGNGLPSELFGKIIINNQEGVYLSAPLTIKSGGSMELTSGILTVPGPGNLVFENSALLLGGGPNAFVNGAISKIGTDDFIFHVGRDGIYSPVQMREGSGGQITDHYRVSYFPIKATTQFEGIIHGGELDHISSNDTWLIEQINADINAKKRFTVTYNERSGVDNVESLALAFLDGIYYRRLTDAIITGTTSSGTITFVPLLYGPFTLASVDLMNPLPVVLSHFTAEKSSGKSLLKWNITPESNADYIEILHRGNTGEFMVIGKVNAAENPKDYLFIHNNPIAGDNYYQLKITDKEGVITYSKVEKLHFEIPGNKIALYPSVGTTTRLHVASEDSKMMKVRVMGQNGQLIKGFEIRVEKGNNSFVIDMNNLPSGVYFIGVYDGNRLTGTERFLRK